MLLRLACKEDKPVSKLVILASPPVWEARVRTSPEEPDLEIPGDSFTESNLSSWDEPRPSVAGEEDSSKNLFEPKSLVLASWSSQRSHSVEDKRKQNEQGCDREQLLAEKFLHKGWGSLAV